MFLQIKYECLACGYRFYNLHLVTSDKVRKRLEKLRQRCPHCDSDDVTLKSNGIANPLETKDDGIYFCGQKLGFIDATKIVFDLNAFSIVGFAGIMEIRVPRENNLTFEIENHGRVKLHKLR